MIEVRKLEIGEDYVALAGEIGKIMPFLSSSHDGAPISRDILEDTIRSTSSAQFVASIGETEDPALLQVAAQYPVVGAATLSILHGVLGKKAWLEDFVVLPDVRKYGVAQSIWDLMVDWRRAEGAYQMRFNSTSDKERAHGFYKRNGCVELASGKTTLFVHNIVA